MTKRKQPRRRYGTTPNGSASLTPESLLQISMKQAVVASGIIAAAGIGYAYLAMGQATQGDALRAISTKLETSTKVAFEKVQEDTASRAKIREDFMLNQQRMTEVLGKLDTRLAVQETNQKMTNDQLGKIVDLLQRPTTAVPRQ